MKRITGIVGAAIAFLGCSYVGDVGASDNKVCAQIFSETALVESGLFDSMAKVTPAEAAEYRRTVIVACNAAINAGKQGVGPAPVAHMLAKSVTANDAVDSLLSVTRVSVIMAGWSVGAEHGR